MTPHEFTCARCGSGRLAVFPRTGDVYCAECAPCPCAKCSPPAPAADSLLALAARWRSEATLHQSNVTASALFRCAKGLHDALSAASAPAAEEAPRTNGLSGELRSAMPHGSLDAARVGSVATDGFGGWAAAMPVEEAPPPLTEHDWRPEGHGMLLPTRWVCRLCGEVGTPGEGTTGGECRSRRTPPSAPTFAPLPDGLAVCSKCYERHPAFDCACECHDDDVSAPRDPSASGEPGGGTTP